MKIAQAHVALEQLDLANEKVEQALALDSRCAAARLMRAKIALLQKNEQQAARDLEEALACDFGIRSTPGYALAKAQLLFSMGEYNEHSSFFKALCCSLV